MTQEKVIKEIENGNFDRVDGIKEIVIEALEKMKTGDLISRKALIEKAYEEAEGMAEPYEDFGVMVDWIANKIPSVQTESKGVSMPPKETPIYDLVATLEDGRQFPISGIETLEELTEKLETLNYAQIQCRCKDCENYTDDGACDLLAGLKFKPDDFCSYGVARG